MVGFTTTTASTCYLWQLNRCRDSVSCLPRLTISLRGTMHGHHGFVHNWTNLQEDSIILALEPLMTMSDISRRKRWPQDAWGRLREWGKGYVVVRRPLPQSFEVSIDCQPPEAVICQESWVGKLFAKAETFLISSYQLHQGWS